MTNDPQRASFSGLRAGLRLSLCLVSVLPVLPFAIVARAVGVVGGARVERWSLRMGVGCQALWARLILRVLGVRIEHDGAPPRMRCVVTSNHLSYVDIVVLAYLFPGRFVAKHEIAGWPVFGVLSRSVATIFIERGRRRDVVRVGHAMRETLDAGMSVLLFPEGGTSRGLGVQRFHSALFESAAQEQLPCLPVAIHYETPAGELPAGDSVCWWGGVPLGRHLWGCMGVTRIVAKVRWNPEPCVDSDRKRLASRAEHCVRELFEPVTQGSPIPPEEAPTGALS